VNLLNYFKVKARDTRLQFSPLAAMSVLLTPLLLAPVTHAQTPPGGAPTSVMAPPELQAVYCESVLQNDLRLLQQMLDATNASAAHPENLPTQVREHVVEALKKTQRELPVTMQDRRAALEQVQSYLAPRRQKLDAQSVTATQERAETDIDEMSAMANRCAAQCESPMAGTSADACSSTCLGKELPERLNRCRKPGWLR
jgi:hypothetical protein